ncbi:thiamine-phosphate pyrophosphorylase [Sulfurimonas sp. HSL1-2]|uniref:thiamine-phosphate pyrophosphorylase n=1 Tax=Thiomicrolovo zhangzhouensis TaxID=3131933 RepID=UPI0031F7B624
MATKTDALSPDLFRVIDANLNRLKEGIRVIEDIARYLQNDKTTASSLKALRHRSRINDLQNLLSSRDSVNDVLRPTVESELNRSSIESILIANYKRAQESSRVLEEMYKIVDPALSETFKQIRYELYTLEKEHLLSSE